MCNFGEYSHALVSGVPNSLINAQSCEQPINLEEAKQQHEVYVQTLRSLGLNVIELPAEEQFPDSVYVEDTAVIIDGVALICRIGHQTRVDEVHRIRKTLKELNIKCIEITDPKALIDGGDVRFTGREIFVGISKNRTNVSGAKALAEAFPNYPVVPIRVPDNLLHLTSCMSMLAPDIMGVSSTIEGQEVYRTIVREANYKYKYITLPVNTGANGLYINENLVHRSEYPEVIEILNKEIKFNKIPTKIWELSKPAANLSCLSILFNLK